MTARKETNDAFVITRVFDAPQDLVFRVWTDPKHLSRWFSPKGFTVTYQNADIRPGGTSLYCMMANSGGPAMWGKAIYKEVIEPSRLVYLQYFSDEKGGVTRHPMSPTWPLQMLTTVLFEEAGGKTKLTLTWTPVDASAEEQATFTNGKSGMSQGWGGTFEQLNAYLDEVKNA